MLITVCCCCYTFKPKQRHKNVKQSRNSTGVAQSVPGDLGPQISMTFCTWRWWGCQPHALATFTTRNVAGTHFHWGLSRTQGHGTGRRNMSVKNPVTPPRIDPGTVRLVAQCINQYSTPGPKTYRCWYSIRSGFYDLYFIYTVFWLVHYVG